LRREFEQYGPVKSIKMVHCTKNGKPRGYAFIEYEHEKDMHCKYSVELFGKFGIYGNLGFAIISCTYCYEETISYNL